MPSQREGGIGAGLDGTGADLLVGEHAEHLAKAGDGLADQGGKGLGGDIAAGDAGAGGPGQFGDLVAGLVGFRLACVGDGENGDTEGMEGLFRARCKSI